MQTDKTSKFQLQALDELVEHHGFIITVQTPKQRFKLGRIVPNKPLPLCDGYQLALRLLGMDVRSEPFQQQVAQLSPITGRIPMTSLIPDIPLMR